MDKKSPQQALSKSTKGPHAAFLLSQIGAHAAGRFGERLAKLNISPHHTGVLRIVLTTPGLTQQALAGMLGTVPSRLVVLLDDLEQHKWIERRAHPSDRRSYALYVTEAGGEAMAEINEIGKAHQNALLAALSSEERKKLTELLQKVADEQGLVPYIHPGYKNLGD